MMKWVAVAVVVVVGPFALADDDNKSSERASLISSIDDKVHSMASELSGFDSQRDYGNADDALSYARDVADLVSKLKDIQGSDSRANAIVSNYPNYLDTFRESTKYLKKLKEIQFRADGVADRCIHDEANLQTLIRNYVASPGEADEAFDKLPQKGQEYGRTYAPLLEKLKDADSDYRSNQSSARFDPSLASNSNYWDDVKSNFRTDVDHMNDYWKDHYAAVDPACKRLALGEKHPDIEKALADLRSYTGSTKETVKQLKHDYNLWLADARKVREMTAQDHAELRETMCRKGVDVEDITQKANAIADRWASQISSAYGTLLGQSDRLAERATSDKLKKYKGAKEVFDGVRANRATLEKIKNSDLQGSNNPKIKVKMQYGIDEHKRRQSSLCSEYKEFEISSSYCKNPIRSNSGCSADCVVPGSTCQIIEIKPDNDEAKAAGDKQKDAYEAGLHDWYAKNKEELFKQYPRIRECESDGKLSTNARLELYTFCPSESEAKGFGEDLDSIPSDMSESD